MKIVKTNHDRFFSVYKCDNVSNLNSNIPNNTENNEYSKNLVSNSPKKPILNYLNFIENNDQLLKSPFKILEKSPNLEVNNMPYNIHSSLNSPIRKQNSNGLSNFLLKY